MAFYNFDFLKEAKNLKYIEYLRKSSEDNEDKQIRSIERQFDDIEELLQRYGLKSRILKVLREKQTAFKTGRPFFEEMMRKIEAGEANAVIVWHPNRIARNYEDGGRFVQLISNGKLKLVISLFGIFGDQPRDKSSLMDEFTKATEDSDFKSAAVISGYKRKLKEGYIPSGRLPEGFVHKKLDDERMINDVDPNRIYILRKAIELVLNGTHTPMEAFYTLRDKWHYTTKKTKRTGGRPIGRSAWYKILSSPTYCGDFSNRKNAEPGQRAAFKPPLTVDEFDRLQIIMGHKGRPRISKHQFAYKEVLRCGGCGGNICADEHWQIICPVCKTKFHKGKLTTKCKSCGTLIEKMRNPKILHYINYFCTKKTTPDCTEKSIRLEVLEKQIDEALQKFEIPKQFRDWAIKYLNELNKNEVKDREIIRKNAKEAYDDCVKKIDNLLSLKISPQNVDGSVISDEEYATRRNALIAEKDELQAKLDNTNQRINNWLELSEKTFNFACYARYWFAHGDLKTKTAILGALGSNLVIKDKNLQISGLKHWFLIEKGKEDLVVLARKFEPAKWRELLGQKELPELFRRTWLRG